jgi:2-methylcitrate dehydratase PrpD
VLEGRFGFLRVFCDEYSVNDLTRDLGDTFLTMSVYMKRFPCHGTAQTALQAIQELRAEYSFAGDNISSIEVEGSAQMAERHNILSPREIMQAQYSVPFSVALACYRDPLDPRSFDSVALEDRRILSLCRRVRLSVLREDLRKTSDSCSVTVVLEDGRKIRRTVHDFRGTPTNPASRADLFEKFSILTRDCSKTALNGMFDRLQNLEHETDVQWLSIAH